ncbi:MAG TPA: hypothetical protein VK923_04275 [Euzebyales bacterium]|nr:hypothetical protein [Euzebyales bacterium]
MEPTADPTPGTAAPQPRWRVSRRARKAALIVHILSSGAWVGIDVIVAVLVATGWFAADTAVRVLAYQALGRFVVAPMLAAGLVCLASGIIHGVGSRYGLVRYWWVAVKLAMNVVLCTLIVVALRPGMNEVVAHGRLLAADGVSTIDVSSLFFPPAVSLTALTFATILAVARPWGLIRRPRRQSAGR